MIARLALALAAAWPAAAPAAQAASAAEAPGLAWLVGAWRGEGSRMGQALEAVLEVRPALGGRFLELSYRSGTFEGRAFYRPSGAGRWRGRWFDNRGESLAILAAASDGALTADWGLPDAEQGRTVYALASDGSLEITDSVVGPDGAPRPFATHRLRRIP